MRIGVLFNCQNVGIAASLRQLLPGHEVVNYRFVDVCQSEQAAEDAAVVLRRCDAVITTVTGARLYGADPAVLAAEGVRIVKIPHLIFGGYHPDSCYSPDPNRGIPGPTERFHSRIAACGFLAGLDIEDTLALYSKLPFARLGYFDHFAQQRMVVIEQWAAHGIDLAPWFARWAAQGCFMHSMNHPKIAALFDLARIMCGVLGLAPSGAAAVPADNLIINASHPVHADIAEALGVPAEMHFRPPNVRGRKVTLMDLPTFLSHSFAAFSRAPVGAVLALDGVPEAMRALDLQQNRAVLS